MKVIQGRCFKYSLGELRVEMRKGGISARELSRILGKPYKTILRITSKTRPDSAPVTITIEEMLLIREYSAQKVLAVGEESMGATAARHGGGWD